jgi:hypothetical protein
VNRRQVVLSVGCVGVCPGSAQATAADAAYRAVAEWLFDLYLERSIQLSVFNVQRLQPGADRLIAPKLPAMVSILARHREPFATAMDRALRQHLPLDVATALAERVRRPPVDLDEATRTHLIAVDSEFRRESQSIIRAVTSDLGGMIDEALAAAPRAN